MADLPLLSAELVQMRHTVEAYLDGTAVLHTKTAAADGQGGQTWTYAASGTVAARLSPIERGRGERDVGGRAAGGSDLVLTIPYHTSADEDDRIVYDSTTYEVAEVMTRVPTELARRLRVVEVD